MALRWPSPVPGRRHQGRSGRSGKHGAWVSLGPEALTAPSAEKVHQGDEHVIEAHEEGEGEACGIAEIIGTKHGGSIPEQLRRAGDDRHAGNDEAEALQAEY